MSVWDYIWLTWIFVFVVIEAFALYSKDAGDTFSERIWEWFAIGKDYPTTGLVRLRRFTLLAFIAWLAIHLLTGGMF